MPRSSRQKSLQGKEKVEGLSPHSPVQLDTLARVRSEMARLYRLGFSGKLSPDRMTKFVYVLREIRAALEAEVLDDVQKRLALLASEVGGRRG